VTANLDAMLTLALQVVRQPQLMTDVVRFFAITAGAVLVFIVGIILAFKYLRPGRDRSVTTAVHEEFERSKAALLLAAQARKAEHEADESAKRQMEVEDKERELLRANVDPQLYFGRTCPLCGLEMMEDQELVIDPYTGAAYHFSSFLSAWPPEQERPKYIYRYPQATVVKSTELVRQF
jgi:hypothetical protein